MEEDMIVVRKVNRGLYRKFKQRATEENMTVGRALTNAMAAWLNQKGHPAKDMTNILKLEGIIKTNRKVSWSEQVDEVLYG